MESTPQVPSEENERKAAAILQQIADLGAQVFFEKPLTASDASGSGRVVIPKAIAEQYFPRLEQPSGLPVRAVDIRGHEYTFKFRFWINNQSRMYLLEGAGELHRQFTMSVGDVMVFAQKMDKTLVVAGRPATKTDVIRKAPVKRPAGEAGPGGKGKSREPKVPKVPKGPGGQQQPQGAQQRRKKLVPDEPSVDGIFRAAGPVPPMHPGGVVQSKTGRWVVTLNLAGELYQALFDTQEDALEAFNAAGGLPSKPGAEGADMAAVTAAAAAASDMAQAALAAAAAAVGAGGGGSGGGAPAAAGGGGGGEDEEMVDADGAGNQ